MQRADCDAFFSLCPEKKIEKKKKKFGRLTQKRQWRLSKLWRGKGKQRELGSGGAAAGASLDCNMKQKGDMLMGGEEKVCVCVKREEEERGKAEESDCCLHLICPSHY